MRIAALYDVHGNLPALEAVLREVEAADVDEIVIGGDVFPGPLPRETIAHLLDLDLPVRFLRGNGDRAVLACLRGEEATSLPPQARAGAQWVAEHLGPAHEALLADWPPTLRETVEGVGEVLFCHATPRSDTEIFTRRTPDRPLEPIFAALGVDLVVCGHTHMQSDRTIGDVRVVNAGSVGMPFGEPGAYWLLLGPGVEFRHTPYDLAAAAERIRGADFPGAADFAAKNVLAPPSEEEMLDLFGHVELR